MSQDDDVEHYVVVPRKPTSEMIIAGVAERHGQPVPEAWSLATANIYRAMIEAGQIRAALSAMPERELLREALNALEPFASIAKEPFAHRDLRRARAAADKIRASLTQEKQT